MKVNCLACGKPKKIEAGIWVDHIPPSRLNWLKTTDGLCIGSGMEVIGEFALVKIEKFCLSVIDKLTEELMDYRSHPEVLMVEIKYAASEDPDKPIGKIWEKFSADEIIEKSIGAGVTNYFVAPKNEPSRMVRIGSESALLAGGRERAIVQKKREYMQYLEKKISTVNFFFNG